MEIFLKMFRLGAQPASVIAKNLGIPRSTTYLYLEELKKLGLVEEFQKSGMKYFKCIPVAEISALLNARKTEIQYAIDSYKEILPNLEQMESKFSIIPKVVFYEGDEAVMKMYEELLKEDSFYSFVNPEVSNLVMDIYWHKIDDEIIRKKMKVKELVVDGEKGRLYKKNCNSKNHEIKLLPKDVVFDSDNLICRDKIFMVSYGEKEVFAIKIQGEILANSYRMIFEQLWKRL